jgi:hypothetical protein
MSFSRRARVEGRAAGLLLASIAATMVFGFFSTSALFCVDWGAALRTERDVRVGGWVCVTLASWVVATLALLTVAGAWTQLDTEIAMRPGLNRSLTFARSLRTLIGGRTAGMMLIGFSLTSLAPACYGASLFSERMTHIVPRLSKTRWTIVGAVVAWLIVGFGVVSHLLPVFGVLGACCAPVAGAIVADYVTSRGEWRGVREGANLPGLVAWVVGFVAGLTPFLARWAGAARSPFFEAGATYAFLAAFLTYLALAALGTEGRELSIDTTPIPDQGNPAAT